MLTSESYSSVGSTDEPTQRDQLRWSPSSSPLTSDTLQPHSLPSASPLSPPPQDDAEEVSSGGEFMDSVAPSSILRLFKSFGKSGNWSWELLSMVMGSIIFVAISMLLLYLDGKPKSFWKLGLNVETIITGILELVVGLMSVAIASSFGQLKWIKYKRSSRTLQEMQIFDDASRRSLIGAFNIVLGRCGKLAGFGILVSILVVTSVAVGQQALTTPIHVAPTMQSTEIYRAVSYTEFTGTYHDANPDASLPMKGAMYDAVYGYASNVSLNAPYTLCEANCTFPPFLTLGIKSDCLDISDLVQTQCVGNPTVCYYSIPEYGNMTFTESQNPPAGGVQFQIDSLTNTNSTFDYPNPSDPIVELTMMNSSRHSDANVVNAVDCQFRFTVHNISAWVTNGVYNQNINDISPLVNLSVATNDSSTLDYILYEFDSPGDTSFVVSSVAWDALSLLMKQEFIGHTGYGIDGLAVFTNDVVEAVWGSGDMIGLMDSVATSMSNRMRAAPYMFPGPPGNISTEVILGTTYSSEPYYELGWFCFILPALGIFLTWVFLLLVMHETKVSGAKIWKTSIMPLLFHGFCDRTRTDLNEVDCETIDAMNERAKKTAVQLRDSDSGRSMLSHDAKLSKYLKNKGTKRMSFGSLSFYRERQDPEAGDSEDV